MKRLIFILMLFLLAYGHIAAVFAQPVAIELLVRTKDGPGGRAKGDIINMKVSPAKWGLDEGPPNYVIVKVEGITFDFKKQYHIRHGKLEESNLSVNAERVRSRYRIDIDKLPKHVDGVITATLGMAVTNAKDRRAEILSSRIP